MLIRIVSIRTCILQSQGARVAIERDCKSEVKFDRTPRYKVYIEDMTVVHTYT